MDPLTMGILGGLLGLGKGIGGSAQTARDYKLSAETARYSPWTGLKPAQVQDHSMISDILAGLGMGAKFGQQFQKPAGGMPDMGMLSTVGSDGSLNGGSSWAGLKTGTQNGMGYLPA